ncbi:hypothetical protein MMC22_003554 [Lobaria immixta]|nr:hypothetical protein [Lobaria immixta]
MLARQWEGTVWLANAFNTQFGTHCRNSCPSISSLFLLAVRLLPAPDKWNSDMAANIEGLHERLDDVVDDVTQLFKLRNKMAKNANRLHVMLEDA